MSEVLQPEQLEQVRFVDAKVVKRNVSRACNRQYDGIMNESTYYVPNGIPGIPQQEVHFEVVAVTSNFACVLLLFNYYVLPFFLPPVPRHCERMRGNVNGS